MASTRPVGVTIVSVVALVSGVLGTIGAIVALVSGAAVTGIIGLILGILTLIVGIGLFSHSQIARILATIVLVLELASAIFSVGSTGFGNAAVTWPIISGILAIAGIILLFTKRANAYFR